MSDQAFQHRTARLVGPVKDSLEKQSGGWWKNLSYHSWLYYDEYGNERSYGCSTPGGVIAEVLEKADNLGFIKEEAMGNEIKGFGPGVGISSYSSNKQYFVTVTATVNADDEQEALKKFLEGNVDKTWTVTRNYPVMTNRV